MKQIEISGFDCLKKENLQRKLLILLHGYGANKEDLFSLSSYLGDDYDYLFPNAPINLAPGYLHDSRCWFPLDMNRFSFGPTEVEQYLNAYTWEKLGPITEELVSFIDEAGKSYDEIVLGGFSQGSMLALLCALKLKRPIKALLLLSCNHFMKGPLEVLLNNYSFPPFSIFQTHGTEDTVLPYPGAVALKKLLDSKGFPLNFQTFSGGHGIDPLHLNIIRGALK